MALQQHLTSDALFWEAPARPASDGPKEEEHKQKNKKEVEDSKTLEDVVLPRPD